jgi:hypothetical protein
VVEIVVGERERFLNAQPGAPQECSALVPGTRANNRARGI